MTVNDMTSSFERLSFHSY